jgi:hypothetical protein
MEKGKANNGTFALHVDMMKHCDEITAIALSERLGGSDGFWISEGAAMGILAGNVHTYGCVL